MDSLDDRAVVPSGITPVPERRVRSAAKVRYVRWLLIGLTVATIGALAWHHYGMNDFLRVDAASTYEMQSVDDRESGGKTESVLRRTDGKLVLECNISAAYQWPYCEIAIALRYPPAGVDLRHYDTVRLWIHYEGPEKDPQVRFFLRNFNPAYSKVGDSMSLKPQEIVYNPKRQAPPLEARLSQFTVASWWSSGRNVPVEYAGTEFDNVAVLDISTGGNVLPGPHRITVERIEFAGKAIPAADVRLGIIALWLVSVISYLVFDLVATRRHLVSVRQHQSSLKRINEGLRIERKQLEDMARTDPLTGLLNRKGLGDELTQLSQGDEAALFPASLVFIDIDHFKTINDRHGHSVGDLVIRAVARVVKENIQRGDLLARWGGEEFLLVCPRTSANDAAVIAERLRGLIADSQWPSETRVTSSFGITELLVGEDLADGIRRADEAMYSAKEGGRDRVEVRRAAQKAEALSA